MLLFNAGRNRRLCRLLTRPRRDLRGQLRLKIAADFSQPGHYLASLLRELAKLFRPKNNQAEQSEEDYLRQAHAFSSGAFGTGATTGSSFPCMAALKPRMPSPIPFPSSGSFFGPNTSKAIPAMIIKCIG